MAAEEFTLEEFRNQMKMIRKTGSLNEIATTAVPTPTVSIPRSSAVPMTTDDPTAVPWRSFLKVTGHDELRGNFRRD
jgi:hypothetical protein